MKKKKNQNQVTSMEKITNTSTSTRTDQSMSMSIITSTDLVTSMSTSTDTSTIKKSESYDLRQILNPHSFDLPILLFRSFYHQINQMLIVVNYYLSIEMG